MEVIDSGFHGSFYFGVSEYSDGKVNKLKVNELKVIKHLRLLDIWSSQW